MAKFNEDKLRECADWVRENGLIDYGGASVKAFCAAMDIGKTTYYEWLADPNFANAINKAKREFAESLERDLVVSLAKAAKGYRYVKKKTEYVNGADNRPVIKKQTSEDVEVQPNVGAAIFLLTNLNPEGWKNRQNTTVDAQLKGSVETNPAFNVDDLPEELQQQIADALQEAEHQRTIEQRNGKKD